jgi:hypothetical protein
MSDSFENSVSVNEIKSNMPSRFFECLWQENKKWNSSSSSPLLQERHFLWSRGMLLCLPVSLASLCEPILSLVNRCLCLMVKVILKTKIRFDVRKWARRPPGVFLELKWQFLYPIMFKIIG